MRFPVRQAESFGNFNAGVNISAWDVRVCGTADTCDRFVRRPHVQRKEEFINISRFRSATLGSARYKVMSGEVRSDARTMESGLNPCGGTGR